MKNYFPIIVGVITIIFMIVYNLSQINPNQHYVNTDNGGYWRTNPNSTTADNIGTNESDIFLGILVILFGLRTPQLGHSVFK